MSKQKFIAYLSPEVAFHENLLTYTGGLGYLAGTQALAAHEAGIPMVIVAPLGRNYRQTILAFPDGRKVMGAAHDYDLETGGILELADIEFSLPLWAGEIWTRVWKYSGAAHGSVDMLFLDTDYDRNVEANRAVTRHLYGGFQMTGTNVERKIAHAFVLGVAAKIALDKLGYAVDVYHLNECHPVFAALELLREELETGCSIDEAIARTRKRVLFTTHTPIPAGIWRFNMEQALRAINAHFKFDTSLYDRLGRDNDDIHLGLLALRLSGKHNAVSKLHADTARKMWLPWLLNDGEVGEFPYVTNGVCRTWWQHPDFQSVASIHDYHRAKLERKRDLLDYIRQATGKRLGEGVMTVVLSRRWTRYKRPLLILDHMESSGIGLALRHNQLQIIFAGMPNPDEAEMVDAWNRALALSESTTNVVILPGYDLRLSKLLKQGADLWVNSPVVPNEACGTSGMGAALNMTPSLSTADGWMAEANPEHHFIYGYRAEHGWDEQWRHDAIALRGQLMTAMSMYYDDSESWYERALGAKREAEEVFTGRRMIDEYANLYEALG